MFWVEEEGVPGGWPQYFLSLAQSGKAGVGISRVCFRADGTRRSWVWFGLLRGWQLAIVSVNSHDVQIGGHQALDQIWRKRGALRRHGPEKTAVGCRSTMLRGTGEDQDR